MTTEEAALRQRVVDEALTWLGTRFHDAACVKGAGVDCVNLLKGVFVNVGLVENFEIEAYSPQFFQHSDEPRFIQGLQRYSHRVDEWLPGNVAMYNYGLQPAHAGIIVDDRTIVHAWKPARRVTKGGRFDFQPHFDSIWCVNALRAAP